MIHHLYENEGILDQIREVLHTEHSVQLHHFLQQETYQRLLSSVHRFRFTRTYTPLVHSFSSTPFRDRRCISAVNTLVQALLQHRHTLASSVLFCFSHRDYTLLHDASQEERGILALFELTPTWQDTYGGYTSFWAGGRETLRLTPLPNSLTLVSTDQNVKRFVKYINHTSLPSQRYVAELTFKEKEALTL